MQEAEQTLNADDPGVTRQVFTHIFEKYLDKPNGKRIHSDHKKNSSILGFKGEGSISAVTIEPSGEGFLWGQGKPAETQVALGFESHYDIKMQVEWFASITDPLGKPLQTSAVRSTVLERRNGQYGNEQIVPRGNYAIRMLKDATFGRHKDIKNNGWLFDGALHVAVDVRFKVLEGGIHDTRSPMIPLLIALRKQLDSPILSDFTLVSADGAHIKTHRLILALQSPVFRAMFENDLEEARTGICKIEDANADSIKAMVGFLLGEEPKEWGFQLTRDIFELADKYELTELLRRSARELSKQLDTRNLPDILMLAHLHSAKQLLHEAFYFLEDNFIKATLDGVVVRLTSDDMPRALFREWQAHWFRRREGVDMKNTEEGHAEGIPQE